MPHVVVKLWPGKSDEQKNRLSDAITRDVAQILNYGTESVSVSMEEISPRDWKEEVYRPALAGKLGTLFQKPGYEY